MITQLTRLGVESARHHEYTPQGYLAAVDEIGSNWRGGAFDIVSLAVSDGIAGNANDFSRIKTGVKTTNHP